MINSNCQLVCKVEVSHTYFENGICSCLEFNIGNSSAILINKYGFKIRKHPSGFELYANSGSKLSAFFDHIGSASGQTSIDFDITTGSQNFKIFTSLPVNWIGQLLYDSQLLSSANDANIVQLAQTLSTQQSAPVLAKLKLHFNDILKFSSATNAAQFNISFKARATQWQYFIINKSLLQLSSPAVSSKSGITFTGPQKVTLDTGEQALLFSSDASLIPLSERPIYKFELVNQPNGNGAGTLGKALAAKIIIRGLPNPDVSRFALVEINGITEVSSPMYVYV